MKKPLSYLAGFFTAAFTAALLAQGFGGQGFGGTGGVSGADPTFTGIVTMPSAAAPTTDADGECAFDLDAWASGRDALECFDGTASTYLVGVLVSDSPSAGQVPKWQTGGTITWENDDNAGAATELDDIADPSGNGAVAMLNTTHVWTSTLDSAAATILTLINSDADRANSTTLLKLSDNDAAGDAEAIYLDVVADADGTPASLFSISSAAFATSLASTFTNTVTLGAIAGTIDGGGATSFEVPNGADPTTNAFGEVAGDNDAWAASRGALEFFDGTASVFVVAALASDTPSNGQVPKWNTGGTITWENDDNAGAATEFDDIADPSGNGAIALVNTTHAWTSTLDSAAAVVLSIANTDADRANATTLFRLADNDAAGDADAVMFTVVADLDGTPSTVFSITLAAITSTLDITVPTEAYDATGWNGDNTVPTKDAVRDIIETFITPDSAVATWMATPTIANFFAALTGEASGTETFLTTASLANFCSLLTGEGTGVCTALGINVGSAGAFVVFNGALGTPTSGTLALPFKLIFNAGVCQNATASSGGNEPTTLGGTAICESTAAASGDPAYGVVSFLGNGTQNEWHNSFPLAEDWTATGGLHARINWRAISTSAGDVVWTVQVGCANTGVASTAIVFNAVTNFAADANDTGATLEHNLTATTSLDITDCAAGETLYFKVLRDTDTSGDTLDEPVQMIWIEFTYRRNVTIGG